MKFLCIRKDTKDAHTVAPQPGHTDMMVTQPHGSESRCMIKQVRASVSSCMRMGRSRFMFKQTNSKPISRLPAKSKMMLPSIRKMVRQNVVHSKGLTAALLCSLLMNSISLPMVRAMEAEKYTTSSSRKRNQHRRSSGYDPNARPKTLERSSQKQKNRRPSKGPKPKPRRKGIKVRKTIQNLIWNAASRPFYRKSDDDMNMKTMLRCRSEYNVTSTFRGNSSAAPRYISECWQLLGRGEYNRDGKRYLVFSTESVENMRAVKGKKRSKKSIQFLAQNITFGTQYTGKDQTPIGATVTISGLSGKGRDVPQKSTRVFSATKDGKNWDFFLMLSTVCLQYEFLEIHNYFGHSKRNASKLRYLLQRLGVTEKYLPRLPLLEASDKTALFLKNGDLNFTVDDKDAWEYQGQDGNLCLKYKVTSLKDSDDSNPAHYILESCHNPVVDNNHTLKITFCHLETDDLYDVKFSQTSKMADIMRKIHKENLVNMTFDSAPESNGHFDSTASVRDSTDSPRKQDSPLESPGDPEYRPYCERMGETNDLGKETIRITYESGDPVKRTDAVAKEIRPQESKAVVVKIVQHQNPKTQREIVIALIQEYHMTLKSHEACYSKIKELFEIAEVPEE